MVLYNEIVHSGALEPLSVFWGSLLFTLGENNSSVHSESDCTLVQRAREGDGGAFDELVVRYQKSLYYSIIRIVLNPEDANDIVQEAFIKAYRNLGSYNKQYRFYTWIYRIALNTALNVVQRRRLREESLEKKHEDIGFDPPSILNQAAEYDVKEITEQVRTALEQLPFEMRSVLIMRVFDEMSYKEIAELLDVSVGTVMSRLNRARSILRKILLSSDTQISKNNIHIK